MNLDDLPRFIRDARRRRAPEPLDLRPTTPFEIQLAEQIKALRADVDRLNSRLTWLFTLIIGASVANVVLSFLQ